MNAFIIALLIVALLYAVMIGSLVKGWKNLKDFRSRKHAVDPFRTFVSIVIAARNEEQNIDKCLQDLVDQDYPAANFEIILTDDHSTDDTIKIATEFAEKHPNLKVISLATSAPHKSGKKAAIESGVRKAAGELIVTTDADCRIPRQWLSTIEAFYREYKPKMISAPVAFEPGKKGVFASFIRLEFISLIASGAGALGIKKPLMCNGANLAFSRQAFLDLNVFEENRQWASGDDMFLMMAIHKKSGKDAIRFLRSPEAIVKTEPPSNLSDFIMQRIRWASKTRAYPDSFTAFTAVVVFLNAMLLLTGTMLTFINPALIFPVAIAWFLKLISDLLLLYPAAAFFGTLKLLRWFIPFQLFHVCYIPGITLAALLINFGWKGRKH